MFETEAEENGFGIGCTVNPTIAWQKGAEFGYNKANEWIPFKKELPPLNKYVLIWNNVDIFPISGKRIQLPDNDWAME